MPRQSVMLPQGYDVHTIPQANHVLSFTEWQNEMLEASFQWILKHFATDVRESRAGEVPPAGEIRRRLS